MPIPAHPPGRLLCLKVYNEILKASFLLCPHEKYQRQLRCSLGDVWQDFLTSKDISEDLFQYWKIFCKTKIIQNLNKKVENYWSDLLMITVSVMTDDPIREKQVQELNPLILFSKTIFACYFGFFRCFCHTPQSMFAKSCEDRKLCKNCKHY